MALGLDHALERVNRNDSSGCDHLPGKLVPLEKFDYHNELMGCVLKKSFHRVNFTGITVRLSYYMHGQTICNTLLILCDTYTVAGQGGQGWQIG